ncbi:Proton pump-interactor [Thalictrum thalictroides]|uniref:Proton pump-interactor n=1 Tax=Thalictrum thalictroides TaxID=46969 RepID=A0A7J6WY11_THATH|nr:Proton pump-interactor [Thalictrum thalictroides]
MIYSFFVLRSEILAHKLIAGEVMGVEVVAADITQEPVKAGIEGEGVFENKEDHGKLNKESITEGVAESIKFGSHGTDVPAKEDGEVVVNANFPKDAVDEWPEPKQIHAFYLVKFRPFEDPKLKIKIDQAEKEIQKKNQARFQLTEALKAKRSERSQIISQLRPLNQEDKQYRSAIGDRRKEMGPLNEALGKLRSANTNRERGVVICSSEEELNGLIRSLNYRIQHESNTLVEEKQLLRDIKQLEGTRDRVIQNAALTAQIQDSMGQKEAIQKQVNNAHFYQNRSLLNNAKELAAKKDIAAVRELAHVEVEKFMSLYNSKKTFRDDYEKRILTSLDQRLLSRDGRIRNPDEKQLVEAPAARAEAEPVAKPNVKRPNEDPKPAPQKEIMPPPKVQKGEGKKMPESEAIAKSVDIEDKDNISIVEKAQKDPPAISAVDAAKLKEMKREEEIAKAKLAVERKKKLAEKAAAKAAVRAQKEAEKKLKESDREKKAKKKAGVEEQTEPEEEVVEPEQVEINSEAPPTSKPRERKESAIRHRPRGKGHDSLPKAILKRRKSTQYWVWAAPAAVLVVMLLALGYYYLF